MGFPPWCAYDNFVHLASSAMLRPSRVRAKALKLGFPDRSHSDRIRLARALLRWSASQLAEKAGVHVTTVQRMLRGKGPLGGTVKTLMFSTHLLNQMID